MNFDLSGETPGPPYVLAGFIPNTSGLDFEPPPCGDFCALLDVGEWKLWTELDGTGQFFFFWDLSLGGAFQPEMLDGVFSATLQVFKGSITVDPVACGVAADGSRTPDCPAVEPPPVPEPATVGLLALFGGALLARRLRTRAG